MAFLSNWIFWVIIALIVFVLALIGYLSDSKKKSESVKEEVKKDDTSDVKTTEVKAEESSVETNASELSPADEWSVMPGVDSVSVGEIAPTEAPVAETPAPEVVSEIAPTEAPVVETPAPEVVSEIASQEQQGDSKN